MIKRTLLSTLIGVAVLAAGSNSFAQQNKPQFSGGQNSAAAQGAARNTGQGQNAVGTSRSNDNRGSLQGANQNGGQFGNTDNKQIGGGIGGQNAVGLQKGGL